MSISPFHGGLVFRKEPVDASYPTLNESKSTITTNGNPKNEAIDSTGLNSRDINEFYNPNIS